MQSPGDCILCETREDIDLLIKICEKEGLSYFPLSYDDNEEEERMFRYDQKRNCINSLRLKNRDSWRRGLGGSDSFAYENIIPISELIVERSRNSTFKQDLFYKMLGVN